MKQLLLRVDDELHARLTAQARSRGVSVNSLANDILSLGIDPTSLTRQDRLRLKLMELGVIGKSRSKPAEVIRPAIDDGARAAALDRMRGIGPIADELLSRERDRL